MNPVIRISVLFILIGFCLCRPSLNLQTYPFSVNPQCAPSHDAAAIDEERGRESDSEGSWMMPTKFLRFMFGLQRQTEPASSHQHQQVLSQDLSQYEDEVVLRFNWTEPEHGQIFKSAAERLVLDLWNLYEPEMADVRIHKQRIRDLLKLLPKQMRDKRRWDFNIPDVQWAVVNSLPISSRHEQEFFDDYRPLRDIYAWMSKMEKKHELLKVENLGLTSEGNELKALRVGSGKTKVVVAGGVQAREWLTVSSTLYAVNCLLNEDPQLLRKHVTVYFVPIVNPDGYEYTWTTDRLWKKNRQATGVALCSGIDINQSLNFDDGEDISQCSENYGGRTPHEALEARHMAHLMNRTSSKTLINFESYSQRIVMPKNYKKDLTKQIRQTTGRDYQMSASDGTSWAVKLPDIERNGFLAHKKYIKEMGEEAHKILQVILSSL